MDKSKWKIAWAKQNASFKAQQSLEQKARKKAEEIFDTLCKENSMDHIPDVVIGLIDYCLLIDPKIL